MSEYSNIIQFYRDCYQTDLKGIRIQNFVSSQCEKRLIPSSNAFFHENYIGIPVDTEWGKKVEQILFLDSKEKTLYAGSVFAQGTQSILGRKKAALTPMYIHQLELSADEQVYSIEIKETYFNPDFIKLINSSDPDLDLNFDTVTTHAPPNPFGFRNQVLLQDFFKQYFKTWDSQDLLNYQNTSFNFDVYFKETIKKNTDPLRIFSCLMLGIFKKPQGSLGVLDELNELAEATTDSSLLRQVFQLNDFALQRIKRRDIYLPTTLSVNQESAFYGTDAYPITQIIGPPGTGKSYTIAALAIDAISNNKSVLIVTRNVQACRVITDIIEQKFDLKGSIIKAYNQVYKRSLLSKLSKAIRLQKRTSQNPRTIANRISEIITEIGLIENDIIVIGESEYNWGQFYAQNKNSFFSIFKDKWYQYKKRTADPIWKLNEKLKARRAEKNRLVKKYIKAKINYDLNKLVNQKKAEFLKLTQALKESNLTQLDEKINLVDYDLVLKALPLWTSTTKEISKCLPLTNALFDLVIFDEASQCDLATAIPSIYRAKKMVVVGDPHQLRHISFLSGRKQLELRQQNEVTTPVADYRNDSLIDWTNTILSNPDQTTYLDEHFRSRTDIIQFSNRKFYNNQLKLVRSNPISDATSSIEIVQTDGARDSKGVNQIEIEQLQSIVQDIINQHHKSTHGIIPTIGISSPFTDQVKQIKKELAAVIPFDQMKRHDILIGTPFHFQGEEKDIMLLSFCIDADTHHAALNYLNREDVFNVLVTRARNRQIVITSVHPSKLQANSLLKEYLESTDLPQTKQKSGNAYDSFFDEVAEYLKAEGYELISQSTIVSGVQIDIVVLHNNVCYCIDLIGYPGIFEEQFSLADLRILNRVEVPIFFLTYSSWRLDRENLKASLVRFLQNE